MAATLSATLAVTITVTLSVTVTVTITSISVSGAAAAATAVLFRTLPPASTAAGYAAYSNSVVNHSRQ